MDFSLSEEQEMLRALFSDFAENEVAPLAEQLDRAEQPPLAAIEQAASLDLLGLVIAEQFGGMNAGWLAYGLLMEALGRVCLSTAVALNVHTTAAMLVAGSSNDALKQRVLPLLAAGEHIGAYAIAEPDAGSDLAAIACRARRLGDGYLLRGRKSFVINADCAGTVVTAARDDAGDLAFFAVPRPSPGLTVGWRTRQMGLRGAAGCELIFEDCFVGASDRLAGDFSAILTRAWRGARLGLGWACLGVAGRGLADSLEFARNRQQFGGPVALKQTIQGYLADMATHIESLRRMAEHCAWLMDENKASERDLAMLKVWSGHVAAGVINKAVQIHGGMGYIKSYHIERLYRDVRAMTILDGTSETQRIVVAADLLKPLGIAVAP